MLTIPLTKKNYNKELKYFRELAIENGFNKQIIQKLIRKHKEKQETFTALQKIETEKSNKWISLTYPGNETSKISRLFKKADKNINI